MELIENWIFAERNLTLAQLQAELGPEVRLAVAVFAYEYRPAPQTVHQAHADLTFSRTGISRVGNGELRWDGERRGFSPFYEKDAPDVIRVVPARYAPYLAMQRTADSSFGPMRKDWRKNIVERFPALKKSQNFESPSDDVMSFWVPVHKLFSGPICLRGYDLDVELHAQHRNVKLRKIHEHFKDATYPSALLAEEPSP